MADFFLYIWVMLSYLIHKTDGLKHHQMVTLKMGKQVLELDVSRPV